MNQCPSFSSNYRCGSQSRKISIGVLIDSISKGGTKDIKGTEVLMAKERSPNKGSCAKDQDGHTSVMGTNAAVAQKDVPSSWFCTTRFNPKASSSVAIHDAEQTPNSLATNTLQSRLKHPDKAFAGKTGFESDGCKQKYFGKTAHFMDIEKTNNEKHTKITAFSKDPGVGQTNVKAQNEEREAEATGNENLKMKLWKILGNISPDKHCPNPRSTSPNKHGSNHQNISPNKHFPNPQSMSPDKHYSNQSVKYEEVRWKHNPVEDRNENSDKIESDSEKQAFGRPTTRSFSRKKTSTKNQRNKTEAQKPSCHRKVCPKKRMLSFEEDWSGRLCGNSKDGPFTSKRNKTAKQSSGLETHHANKHETAEKQPERKKRSMVHGSKLSNANNACDERYRVFEEPNIGTKQNYCVEEKKDVEQMADVETPTVKGQQVNSLMKNTEPCVRNPLTPNPETKSPGRLLETKEEMLHGHDPDKKIFITEGIRSFKSLLSSRSAKGKANVQLELSDGRCEFNESLHHKSSHIMQDNSGNQMSKSFTNLMDGASLEDASDTRDGTESEQLSPEGSMGQKFPHGTDTNLGKEEDVEMTTCIPESKSIKGTQDSSELQIYLEQNTEDNLASAVALINVALHQIKMKLKSMTNKRSAEVLCAAAQDILLLFQNVESQIKTDVGKFTSSSQSESKHLEHRFKEQQEQLLGIYKRFKDEVGRNLKNYSDIIEDVEENTNELKRNLERQRAAHEKLISQAQQAVKVQLEDAERRIMAIQQSAKERMLQLKLVVAESMKHVAFR